MTDSNNPPSVAGPPARGTLRPFLRHGWPLLLTVLSGVAMAAVVLDLTVFAR